MNAETETFLSRRNATEITLVGIHDLANSDSEGLFKK